MFKHLTVNCDGKARSMDQITIETPNPKCRLSLVSNRVNRLEIQSVMLVFSSVVDPDPGSGSVLDPYSIGPLDPDPDP